MSAGRWTASLSLGVMMITVANVASAPDLTTKTIMAVVIGICSVVTMLGIEAMIKQNSRK